MTSTLQQISSNLGSSEFVPKAFRAIWRDDLRDIPASPCQSQPVNLNLTDYYHRKDPISGNLDYYNNLDNREAKYKAS